MVNQTLSNIFAGRIKYSHRIPWVCQHVYFDIIYVLESIRNAQIGLFDVRKFL